MGIIKITSMNRGINYQQDPSAIPDGFVAECIGFDMVPESRLDTAGGIAIDSDLTAYLPPTGDIQWVEFFYIGTTRYVFATTSAGLYINGTLKDASFTGRFKGVAFVSNIYVCNGSYAKRFDGTDVYQWGIDYPTSVPTIEPGSGTGSLTGDYYFLYTYVRTDISGNIIHESSPTRVDGVVQAIGPVTFAGESVAFSNRPLSSDPQVSGANLYAVGGNLADYWLIYTWPDNTTVSGDVSDIGEDTASSIMQCLYNYPAPAGQDVALFWNKIFMVGCASETEVLRTSDILADGTLAPEGWPLRNAYELDGNNGALLNIDLLGQKLSVKGEFGEWQVDTTDPTDYLQTRARQVSPHGLASQDAIVRMPDAHIYPSKRGFVQTNGNSAQFIIPEATPIIDAYISQSTGITAGLVSYFTYNTVVYGYRTAKIDLFSGQLRFTNINDLFFSQLFYDAKLGRVYCIYDGDVGVLDSGTKNEFSENLELTAYLKSKTFQLSRPVVWSWISFQHNTNGIYYVLKVYVDNTLHGTFNFNSTTRTLDYFRFGPISGTAFYFTIEADYTLQGIIYMPIRIGHSGE